MSRTAIITKVLKEAAQRKLQKRREAYESILKLRKKVKDVTSREILRWLYESKQ